MLLEGLRVYRLDVEVREPFSIAIKTFFRVSNLIVALMSDEGVVGYGESAPEKLITLDTVEEAESFLKALEPMLEGMEPAPGELNRLMDSLEERGVRSQTARAAVDMAVYDLLGKARGVPAYKLISDQVEPHVAPTTVTIGIRSPGEVAEAVRRYVEELGGLGLRRVKLKLEGDMERDVERVRAAASAFEGELTLDANQGYRRPEEAVEALRRIWREHGDRILLVEEPCRKGDLEAMKMVKEAVEIPVFADESVVDLEDLRRVGESGCASGVNIKLQKCGGITPALKMAEAAERYGLKLMVGSMAETTLSLSAAIHFTAATPSIICEDLDSDIILFQHVQPMSPGPRETFREGARVPPDGPGLGVSPSPWLEELLSGRLRAWRVV